MLTGGHSKENLCSLAHSDGRYYDVNFFEYYPDGMTKDSHPSAYIFSKVIENISVHECALSRALDLRGALGINTTLWGLRKEGNEYSLEYYFFYPKKYPQHAMENLQQVIAPHARKKFSTHAVPDDAYLISYNLEDEHIRSLNVYRPMLRECDEIVEVSDTGFRFNKASPVFHSYSLREGACDLIRENTYYTYFGVYQLHEILENIYSLCRSKFPEEKDTIANSFLTLPYIYAGNRVIHSSAVTSKDGAIGLYFSGLCFESFILFLKHHDYEAGFVKAIEVKKGSLSHMKYDVGLDFYIKGGEFHIKKTAFWGTF